jgi:hypothetical protein
MAFAESAASKPFATKIPNLSWSAARISSRCRASGESYSASAPKVEGTNCRLMGPESIVQLVCNIAGGRGHIEQCLPRAWIEPATAKTGDIVGGFALCRYYHSDRSWLHPKKDENAN